MAIRRTGPFCDAQKINRPEGETCRNPPGWRTDHPGIGRCYRHGGNTRTQRTQARRIMAEQTATLYGIPRHIDPADGLIEEYWRTAGIVAGLEQLVAGIPHDDLVFGVHEVRETAPNTGPGATQGGEQAPAVDEATPSRVEVRRAVPNVWLKLFQEERDRYAKLGIEIVRLGLEARRDEYIRAQVEVFAGVLQAPELALTSEQLAAAARLLRALGGQPRMIEGEAADERELG